MNNKDQFQAIAKGGSTVSKYTAANSHLPIEAKLKAPSTEMPAIDEWSTRCWYTMSLAVDALGRGEKIISMITKKLKDPSLPQSEHETMKKSLDEQQKKLSDTRADVVSTITGMRSILPCPRCTVHFHAYLKEHPLGEEEGVVKDAAFFRRWVSDLQSQIEQQQRDDDWQRLKQNLFAYEALQSAHRGSSGGILAHFQSMVDELTPLAETCPRRKKMLEETLQLMAIAGDDVAGRDARLLKKMEEQKSTIESQIHRFFVRHVKRMHGKGISDVDMKRAGAYIFKYEMDRVSLEKLEEERKQTAAMDADTFLENEAVDWRCISDKCLNLATFLKNSEKDEEKGEKMAQGSRFFAAYADKQSEYLLKNIKEERSKERLQERLQQIDKEIEKISKEVEDGQKKVKNLEHEYRIQCEQQLVYEAFAESQGKTNNDATDEKWSANARIDEFASARLTLKNQALAAPEMQKVPEMVRQSLVDQFVLLNASYAAWSSKQAFDENSDYLYQTIAREKAILDQMKSGAFGNPPY